jgi:hypothetical protein
VVLLRYHEVLRSQFEPSTQTRLYIQKKVWFSHRHCVEINTGIVSANVVEVSSIGILLKRDIRCTKEGKVQFKGTILELILVLVYPVRFDTDDTDLRYK